MSSVQRKTRRNGQLRLLRVARFAAVHRRELGWQETTDAIRLAGSMRCKIEGDR